MIISKSFFSNLKSNEQKKKKIINQKKIKRYLGEQFYERNYTITQRLDILEVLSLSAQELSSFQVDESEDQDFDITLQEKLTHFYSSKGKIPSQSDIVALRIEEKTKRFSKKLSMKPKKTQSNKFGAVAGNFFYPLLSQYDTPKFFSFSFFLFFFFLLSFFLLFFFLFSFLFL